ncbi:MAG TPA: DMT family transporter [Bryobacteraceae bacterium]|nr:DMT family transporter [Bryobacteraceae bacterium]
MRSQRKARAGLLWVAAGACLWGTDTVFRRPLTGTLDSLTIVLLEHLITALVLLPSLWFHRREWLRLRAAEWAAVIGIAWGGSALATVLFTEAVRGGNPTTAVLLQKSQPMIAALLAGLFLSEPLGAGFWTRLAAATGGAYLISFGAHAPSTTGSGAASLLALGAAALWAASTVLGRYMLRNVSASTLTALRLTVALPVLMLGVSWQYPGFHIAIGARQASWLVLLALVPGVSALMIYYRGLRSSFASRAAVAELCFPATAILLNRIFFGTRLSVEQGAGFLLLIAAILSWQGRRTKPIRETDCATVSQAVPAPPLASRN